MGWHVLMKRVSAWLGAVFDPRVGVRITVFMVSEGLPVVCLFLFCGMETVSPYEIGGEGGKCAF